LYPLAVDYRCMRTNTGHSGGPKRGGHRNTFEGIPIGDLERIRDLDRKCAGWVEEWDFVRDAVRRGLDECRQRWPNANLSQPRRLPFAVR
jgi:hypothetical protein